MKFSNLWKIKAFSLFIWVSKIFQFFYTEKKVHSIFVFCKLRHPQERQRKPQSNQTKQDTFCLSRLIPRGHFGVFSIFSFVLTWCNHLKKGKNYFFCQNQLNTIRRFKFRKTFPVIQLELWSVIELNSPLKLF